ncbi:hypothetical protein L1987_06702 [Smallanthus sonchifolius]|uniref:Uncharacterized protein n=1 Tax=Smallanthus sonchifolius TaxID=185202 RepID=A0ACB9JYV5_9ASTR|nr:hypothetical protein L1987_06702 [Smallanthus sonchifolius]
MSSSSRTTRIGRFFQTCKVYGAYNDSHHYKIKHEFMHPSTVLNVPKSELAPNSIIHPFPVKTEYIPELEISMEEPPPGTNEDPAFWTKVSLFCDSISALDRSITPPPTLRTPSCLFNDDPSFPVESPNTLMFWANHNSWEDELSQDSHYTPFDDEFSQDEINAIMKNK